MAQHTLELLFGSILPLMLARETIKCYPKDNFFLSPAQVTKFNTY